MGYEEAVESLGKILNTGASHKNKLTKEHFEKFKQLILHLQEKYGTLVSREMLLSRFIPNDAVELKRARQRLLKITRAVGIKTQARNRYFKEITEDKVSGTRFWTYRRESMLFYFVETEKQ